MNSNQIQSIVRTVLKFIAAFFIAHGYVKAGNEVSLLNTDQIVGGVIGAISTIWSLIAHAGSGSNKSGGSQLSLFVLLLMPGLFLQGCKNGPTIAYKAESATDLTISGVMTGWGAYVKNFHPGTNQEMQVKSAFEKAQQAELFSVDATAAYAAASSTNSNVSTIAMTQASQSAAQALSDLSNLVILFSSQTNKP